MADHERILAMINVKLLARCYLVTLLLILCIWGWPVFTVLALFCLFIISIAVAATYAA